MGQPLPPWEPQLQVNDYFKCRLCLTFPAAAYAADYFYNENIGDSGALIQLYVSHMLFIE
jgi:hypothetical protein